MARVSHATDMMSRAETAQDLVNAVRYSRALAINAIMAETKCTMNEAASALLWIDRIISAIRRNSYHPQILTLREMWCRDYVIIDSVIKCGHNSQPDSAHAEIEAALLDPSERGLCHEVRNEPGPASYYGVQADISIIR